ncbi:elongation of very long chain fatty acids protein 4-like [Dendronephthya gigantea]|uniref:elongation of very long chain fatty acids protein 4-like n=1 Tax=Dendronephthya gigantea TaxID=151771 RepID=UPI00106D53F1|nr:elongation of very long chain fatty acids protein 4-like [Dendronephthya gigantea]XP_028407152.1 elongation of very long chain fatty acids protein 4-like [Dendronephthya gigantea]
MMERIVDHYHTAMELGDPRTANWPFMSTPWSTLLLVFLYVMIVSLGPRVMKSREAFDLKAILVIYNFGLVILSTYMLYEYLASVSSTPGFNYWCQGVDPGNHPSLLRHASVTWLYFISKFIEFFDTFFFILRKKDNQVSFLHVYHHISVCLLWWTVVKWNPGGTTYFGASLNCFVHIVMYFYYMVSALGPKYRKYLWWKKYLTSLQMIQFTMLLVYILHAITIKDCTFPRWVLGLFFCYGISLLILFANFFAKSYINRVTAEKGQKSN